MFLAEELANSAETGMDARIQALFERCPALCGFSVERAKQEWETQLPADGRRVLAELAINDRPAAGPPDRLFFLDGNQYTSRPGPRVTEGFAQS